MSVEMALSLPVLVFFFLGVTAFTHASYVRYVITGQAHAAARACSLARLVDEGKCVKKAKQLMSGSDKTCNSFDVAARLEPLAGLEQTQLLTIDVTCEYSLFAGFFAKIGMPVLDLSVKVVVPY